jgi:hypothetical protein
MCALSESTRWPGTAPLLLQQAETVIEIGTRIGHAGQVVAFNSVGIYKLLLQIGDFQHLHQFADEVPGSVTNYDVSHKLLVHALSIYLSQYESLKRTARRPQVRIIPDKANRTAQSARPYRHGRPALAHICIKIVEAQRTILHGTSSYAVSTIGELTTCQCCRARHCSASCSSTSP